MASALSMGIDFNTITDTLGQVARNAETTLRSTLNDIQSKSSPSEVDMLNMQRGIASWTLMIQTESTVIKDVGDTLKGIVEKAA